MPFYEYQCQDCGHQMEALQKMSDDPLRDCPKCNEPALKKMISAAAFHLKGTGWYETDFKNNDKKSADSDSADSASKSSTDSAKSSDTKAVDTAVKSDSKPVKKTTKDSGASKSASA